MVLVIYLWRIDGLQWTTAPALMLGNSAGGILACWCLGAALRGVAGWPEAAALAVSASLCWGLDQMGRPRQ